MKYSQNRQFLVNDLEAIRQELFQLTRLVDKALLPTDLRKLRVAHKKVTAFMTKSDLFAAF